MDLKVFEFLRKKRSQQIETRQETRVGTRSGS